MTSFEAIAPPTDAPVEGWGTVLPPRGPSRVREDVTRFFWISAVIVLLGAPTGLLWSAVAPHYTVVFVNDEATLPFIESTKAFIGADGTFVLVTAVAGVLCGLAAWFGARRSGPWTVAALAVGGVLAALVAQHVGLIPGRQHAIDAYNAHKGSVDLFLGGKGGKELRMPWTAVIWPVTALLGFLVPALISPEELD